MVLVVLVVVIILCAFDLPHNLTEYFFAIGHGEGKVCSQAQEADTNSWKSQEHIDRPVEGELGPGGNGYTC